MGKRRDVVRRPPKPHVGPPPSLAEVQSRFQAAILDGRNDILGLIPGNPHTTGATLFNVYRHAYAGRLIEVVGNDYPCATAWLGAQRFRALALAYLTAHPSRTPNARWFSHRLPEFLAGDPRFASNRALVDLARIEWGLNLAFDAADDPVLTLAGLAAHDPSVWGDLRFTPHASARLQDIRSNALDIWRAVKNGDPAPVPAITEAASAVLTWRGAETPKVRLLGTEEAMLWREASAGVRFSVLCELAATYDDPDTASLRVAQVLQGWINAGLLSEARLP